ncbi:K(+) efflux antiporter 6-like [Juglans microcarpa x Juglans regia]|uniref:K(+) efflux antiporter 6-like n=1 Tax=Juglans microcarpa x Juglans regia TaxID=2249226 RepID=UPI001B7EAD1E|nr:K(+) efflux antiporter 6-like [Juglans microcarpa x Juglans regia]
MSEVSDSDDEEEAQLRLSPVQQHYHQLIRPLLPNRPFNFRVTKLPLILKIIHLTIRLATYLGIPRLLDAYPNLQPRESDPSGDADMSQDEGSVYTDEIDTLADHEVRELIVGPNAPVYDGTKNSAVGLLFALLPVLGGTSGVLQGVMSMTKVLVLLITFLAVLTILSRTCVPWLLKLMISLSSQTNELYQLASVAFCLLVAWCSDKLGLSVELGLFAAGVMISTTDLAQHTLDQVEPIRNLFAALFLASIGMLIHVQFLWNHVDILLAYVLLVIIVKTIIISVVVNGFTYNNKTSLLVRY